MTLLGIMQDKPLLISDIIQYAGKYHSTRHIISRDGKYPPAKPGALGIGPLKAAVGTLTRPRFCWPPKGGLSATYSFGRAEYPQPPACGCTP
jgi:hypothetical protein